MTCLASSSLSMSHGSVALTNVNLLILSNRLHLFESLPVSSRWNDDLSHRNVNIE